MPRTSAKCEHYCHWCELDTGSHFCVLHAIPIFCVYGGGWNMAEIQEILADYLSKGVQDIKKEDF